MDHKTLSRKLTIEQTTRISMTSEDKLKYRVNHDSERSCMCVRVSILLLSTNFEGRIVMLELFMLFLLSPYFYSLYLFIVFIYFISYVGLFVLWCFNATFNKFSVLSWRSVLLVEETGGQGENQLIFLCTSLRGLKYLNHI